MLETTNRHLAADEFLGRWGARIIEEVHDLKTADAKAVFIQTQLLMRLHANTRSNLVVRFCVDSLRTSFGRTPISDLERETGYSRRYLEMLFKHHVGVSPKTFATICRFQRFYRIWAQGMPYNALAQEIYDHYFDQAHFAKEFKRMTGFPPLRFSREIANEFGRHLSLR